MFVCSLEKKKLKQYKDKTAAVRRHFSLFLARSRLDKNGKHRFLSSLLPQHFAPLHEFLLLLVQEQRLHTGQEVLRAEAVLSAKNRNETKRKSKETESFHFRWGGSQIARFQEKKWRPSVVGLRGSSRPTAWCCWLTVTMMMATSNYE